MKEYCLVPRATAEKVLLKSDNQLKRKTPSLESSSHARITPPVSLEHVINNNNNNNNKPSIDHLVALSGTVKSRKYLLDLLEILKQNPEVSWDSYGNTLKPITGINVPRLLKILTELNKLFNNEELPLIRLFIHSVPGISQFIRNSRAFNQLYNVSPITKQGGSMKNRGKKRKISRRESTELDRKKSIKTNKKKKMDKSINTKCSWLSYYY